MRWSRSARPREEIAGQRRGSWRGRCCPARLRWPDGRRRVRRRMRWSLASFGWKSGSSLGGGTKRLRATCCEHAIRSRSGRNAEATIVGRAANRADRQVAGATAARAGFAEGGADRCAVLGRAGRFDRIWRSPPALFTGGADGSVGRPDSLSQRTGTDVSVSVGETPAEFGLSPGTVRRRARRSFDALASACRSGRFAPSI